MDAAMDSVCNAEIQWYQNPLRLFFCVFPMGCMTPLQCSVVSEPRGTKRGAEDWAARGCLQGHRLPMATTRLSPLLAHAGVQSYFGTPNLAVNAVHGR